MASLRKRYQTQVEVPSADNNAPAVASAQVEAAVPPPAVETKAPEKPVERPSPADEAANDALRQRLAEMNHAQELSSAAVQQGQRLAAEPPQQQQQPPTPEQIIANATFLIGPRIG